MIKATHLRSKTGTPIFGKHKGKTNDAVTRDRKIAQELVKFKYTDTIMTEGTMINLSKEINLLNYTLTEITKINLSNHNLTEGTIINLLKK